MELYFKKPSKEARKAMCEAVNQVKSKNELMRSAEKSVCNLTHHKHSKIVNSGNSAILAVMSNFKDEIMVPDQGGWSGFIKIAQFLGLKISYLPTDWGLIDPQILRERMDKEKPEALFLTSFAGYTAEQPIKEIHEICSEEDVVMVEDASGSLGDDKGKLANGNHSDIIIASTGSPKIVNVGNGGLISTDQKEFMENKYILRALRADPITCAGISQEIKNTGSILRETISACGYLKNELENIFHQDKRGINVIVKTHKPRKMAKELRSRLNVHNGGMVSKCPRYDRVLDDAVALELKNLDVRCLTTENLHDILKILNDLQI